MIPTLDRPPLYAFFRGESERLVQQGQPELTHEEILELIGIVMRTVPHGMDVMRATVDRYFRARFVTDFQI